MESTPVVAPPDPTPSIAPAPEKPEVSVKPPAEHPKQPGAKIARNNPVIAIAVAILLALILSGLSLVSYLRSDTRRVIQLIQKPSSDNTANVSTIDTTSPLKSADLDTIQTDALKDLDGVSDTTDFSPNDLTDAALGL